MAVVLVVALAGGAFAYLKFFAPLSAEAYREAAARELSVSFDVMTRYIEVVQKDVPSGGYDEEVDAAKFSSANADLKREVETISGIRSRVSALRVPKASADDNKALLSWLDTVTEVLNRQIDAISSAKQGTTYYDYELAQSRQFGAEDPRVKKFATAMDDARSLAGRLGVSMKDYGILENLADFSAPVPTRDDASDGDGTPALTSDQLNGGQLPAGHPQVGGDIVPAGTTPREYVLEFGKALLSSDYKRAYSLLPADAKTKYGDAVAFADQVKPYGITGSSVQEGPRSGSGLTIIQSLATPAMTLKYAWEFEERSGSWYLLKRSVSSAE